MCGAGHGARREVQLGPRAEAILSFLSWPWLGQIASGSKERLATSLYYQLSYQKAPGWGCEL